MKLFQALAARYRYSVILLQQMVKTDFKLRYQGSVLGYFWSLLKPLALFTILYIVFVRFLRFGTGIEFFPIYMLLGIVLWTFFAEVTNQGLISIVNQGDLMRKLNFPRYVIVLATAFSALINLGLNLLVVSVFMLLARVSLHLTVVWVPFLIVELFILALAVAFLLSAMYVRFRDMSHIWEVVLQGAFYATPIIYPINQVPDKYARLLLLLNPMAQIIQDLRHALLTPQARTFEYYFGAGWLRLIPIGIVALLVVISASYFKRRAKYFAEEV